MNGMGRQVSQCCKIIKYNLQKWIYETYGGNPGYQIYDSEVRERKLINFSGERILELQKKV